MRRDLPVLRVQLQDGGHGYVVDDTDVRYRYLPRLTSPTPTEAVTSPIT